MQAKSPSALLVGKIEDQFCSGRAERGVCHLFYGCGEDQDGQKVNDDAGLPDDAIDE
jgi:hypothetical protein